MIGYERTSLKGAAIQRQESYGLRNNVLQRENTAHEWILFYLQFYKAKSYLESRLYLIYCAVYLPHPGNSTFLYLGQLYIEDAIPSYFWFIYLVFYCCWSLRVAKHNFSVSLQIKRLNSTSTSCHILHVNPSQWPCKLISWVQEHVGVYTCWFSKCGECPAPWVTTGEFWFRYRILSCCLPLVHHYKETAAPHSSFSQVTIVMRSRKARAVGLDLNSVAVETWWEPNMGIGEWIT